MAEKIIVEFTVTRRAAFEEELAKATYNMTTIVGYRAGDQVDRRSALQSFSDRMELKLRKNDHKTSWRVLPIEALKRLLLVEIEEFKVALEFLSATEARNEAVDIANFALILDDRLGMMPDQAQGLDHPANRAAMKQGDLNVETVVPT